MNTTNEIPSRVKTCTFCHKTVNSEGGFCLKRRANKWIFLSLLIGGAMIAAMIPVIDYQVESYATRGVTLPESQRVNEERILAGLVARGMTLPESQRVREAMERKPPYAAHSEIARSEILSGPWGWALIALGIIESAAFGLFLCRFSFGGASNEAVIGTCTFVGGGVFVILNITTGIVPGGLIGGVIGGGLGTLFGTILNWFRKHGSHECT